MLDTITRGKSSKKIDATTLPMAVAAAAKAQPCEPGLGEPRAADHCDERQRVDGFGHETRAESHMKLQVNQPKVITAANQPSRPDSRAHPVVQSSPSVLSVRYAAPTNRQSTVKVTPVYSPKGTSSPKKLPV